MHSVIFDFNGTLFQDSEKHMAAWHVFADRYGKRVTREELEKFFSRQGKCVYPPADVRRGRE